MKSSRPPPKPEAGERSEAEAALIEQGRQWFAEARAQTARDTAEVEAWQRRRWKSGDGGDGSNPAVSDDDGGAGGD